MRGFADAALRSHDNQKVAGRWLRDRNLISVDLEAALKDANPRGLTTARPRSNPTRLNGDEAAVALRKSKFLAAFIKVGTVSGAARKAGIGSSTHNAWLESDADYAIAFKEVFEAAVDSAEEALRSRGIHGVRKPVFYQGEQVATVVEYSDSNLQFYLRGRRSSVYRDKTEISGPDGGPIAMAILDKLAQGRARVAAGRKQAQLDAHRPVMEGQVVHSEEVGHGSVRT